MAAPELTRRPNRRGLPCGLRGAWVRAYGAIWLATLTCAALVAALGPPVTVAARKLLALRLSPSANPPPELEGVLALALHNLPIVAWPLLLSVIGAHRHPLARRIADVAVIASIAANTLPVGVALGTYGPRLLPYLPHLPLEWTGLALGASAWLLARRQAPNVTEALALLGLLASMALGAAALEALATPHR